MRRVWIVLLALAVSLAGALYLGRTVRGVSPYAAVNGLYAWERMSFTADRETYPREAETVTLTFRNDAPDGAVLLSDREPFRWCLEKEVDGVWRSLRHTGAEPRWRFREEDCTAVSTPSGVVPWDGGEFVWYCDIAGSYPTPLEAGSYRIVIPDCEHLHDTADLAVFFRVA